MWFGGGSWRSQRYTLATEIWPRALGCTPSWPWPPTWYPSRGTRTGDAAHAGAQDGTGARCSPGATGHARRAAEARGTAGGVSRYPAVTGRHGRSGPRPEPGNGGRALVKDRRSLRLSLFPARDWPPPARHGERGRVLRV